MASTRLPKNLYYKILSACRGAGAFLLGADELLLQTGDMVNLIINRFGIICSPSDAYLEVNIGTGLTQGSDTPALL